MLKKLFVLTAVVFAVSCGVKRGKDKKTLYAHLSQNPETLNPIPSLDVYSSFVQGFMYDSLFVVTSNLEFRPWMVEKYQVLNGGRVWRLTLRKDLKWSDGVPITTKDVKFTYEKILDPASRAINKAGAFSEVKDFRVIDDYTFEVEFKGPFAPALEKINYITPIPEHIYRNETNLISSPFNENPVVSGPYKLKKWVKGSYLILERNPNYWAKEKPFFDRIIIKIIKQSAVTLNALKKGEIDICGLRAVQWVKESNNPDFVKKFNKFVYQTMGFSQIAWQCREDNPFFSDYRVRQAMTHALERQKLVDKVLYGYAEVISGPFYPGSWAYDHSVKPFKFDLDKASKLLDEAGWKDTDGDGIRDKDGRKFEFELLLASSSETGEQIAINLQENLKKIGVVMHIRKVDWSIVTERMDKGQFDAVMFGWSLDIDPDCYDIWHSSQIKGGLNFTGYSNPEVDRLIELGRTTLDKEKRKQIYHQIHRIIHHDQPYTFLFSGKSLVAADKRIKGISTSPVGIYFFYPGYYAWYVE